MSTIVTIEHLRKFLEKKLVRGVYGSVQIYLKDGEVESISFQEKYNPDAFVKHVEPNIKRYTVKTSNAPDSDVVRKVTGIIDNNGQNDQNNDSSVENKDGIDC